MSENEDTKAISLLRTDPSMLKTIVTEEELEYRKIEYGSEEKVLKKQRIECTGCAINIKDQIISGKKIFIHPSLEVLLCKDCKDFYGDGNFSVDEDGSDKYCRWCGQGGNLYCCSHCSVAICSKCVKRNFPKSYIRVIQSDDWRCFVCDTKPIWPHRALCSAAKQYIENLQKKKKPNKLGSTSETEETATSRVKRPKRNRVTTSEATSESEDIAASPVKRSKKRLMISSEEESEIEGKAKNTNKPVLVSSSDEKTNEESASKPGRSRSSTDVSSPTSPASKQKFMEHVINDTLNDYEKLIKIMMKSKANFIDKYVKNKRYLRNVQNLAILRDKLLELLKHSKEGVQCLERNCLSSLKCFDLIPSEKSGNESVEPDTEESVCSQDKTELMNDSKLEDDLGSPAKFNSEATPASSSTPEKKINGVEVVSVDVTAASDISTSVVEAKDTPDNSEQNSISRPPTSTENAFSNKETDNESIKYCQSESVRESNVETEKSSKLNTTEGPEVLSNVDLKPLPEVSRDDAVVADSENNIQEKEDASNLKAEESAEDSSLPNKNKAAKMAMLQFSSDGNSSSSGKEDAKSNESDMSGIGLLKPDPEEAKSKKKKKRRELNEAKKLFLQNSASSDQDSDIERLTNLKNLRRRKKLNNSKRSSEADSVTEVEKKENSKKCEESDRKSLLSVNKGDKSWAMDYVVSSSVSDNETGTNEVSFSDFINTSDRKQKELSLKKDEISKKILLNSSASDEDKSNSDSDQLLDITDLLKKPEKKTKQSQRQLNGNKPSNEVSAEEKDDDSDNISIKVKGKWRNDKLLRGKLSESDTNDDEKIIVKNKKKLEKENNTEKNNCDSSDSGDIFRPIKKIRSTWKKRRMGSSSETEADLKNSNSDSVKVISDDSDKPKKKLKKRKRIKNTMDDSDESEENLANASQNPGSASKGRKNIRKVLKDEELAEQTRKTAKEEEKRKKRISERQALFNKSFQIKDTSDQAITKLVLDFDEQTKEELISVHPELLKKLKPHQVQGVKFMWDSCFESIKQIEKGVGGGCILAHCMGLGKTLQVITLIHTLLRHEVTKVKTVLVICPLSTVLNWVGEFEVWLKDIEDCEDINIYELTKYKNNVLRADCLKHWHKEGGIMVMGYDMFRSLVMAKKTKEKVKKQIHNALLDPGPDLVICDEGHMLKNEKTAISKATMQIKSLRRIVLTGTPLQNNLIEYHCMMQFVKPNLLGDKKEFQNRFVHPITNGQYVDSTQKDVKLMKRRAHVLHKMLDGIVQRFDYKVLTPFLPPKHEFVISVALSDLQAKLYEFYINHKSQIVNVGNTTLFKDYQIMRLIWTHPLAMKLNDDRKQKFLEKQDNDDDSEGSLKDFVVSGTDEETSKTDSDNSCKSIISVSSGGNSKKSGKPKGRLTRTQRKVSEMGIKPHETENEPEYESVNHWWHEFVSNDDIEDYKQGPKLVLLFAILRQCELIGDKVLIFSQSIPSLDMIEYFLQKTEEFSQRVVGEDSLVPDDDLADYIGTWQKNVDYFRLDGQTPNDLRSKYCKIFNRPGNLRARLFLISTRAGGLGINLTAANRVIIFDASWNPSYDIQSIFRVYRFGQNKPCYIYRFLSQGTMEEKIYERQVTKLSISCRVVDEQQIDRHFSRNEVAELYNFNRKMPSLDETPKLPSDRLMAELLKEYKDIILSYHEHDSLLENIVDEDLTEEEKKQAWSDYENEKNHPPSSLASRMDGMSTYPNSYRSINNEAIMKALKTEHPTANPQQLMTMFDMVRNKLEKYYQEQMLIQQMGMVPPMNIQQPPMNVPPNMSTASPQELQEQIQLRKAAFLHQLQAQAAIRQQQDANTGFCGSERDLSTPRKADQLSTSKGYSPMSTYSSPKKTTPSSSPFSTPKKLDSSMYGSISSPNSSSSFSNLNVDSMSPLPHNDPLKVPSTWTFHWDEPFKKDVNDLQTLITEKTKSWATKFEIIGKNVLMHLSFCVRRDTIEKNLSPYLSRLRFNRVQPDISVEDALDVIVKSLKL